MGEEEEDLVSSPKILNLASRLDVTHTQHTDTREKPQCQEPQAAVLSQSRVCEKDGL